MDIICQRYLLQQIKQILSNFLLQFAIYVILAHNIILSTNSVSGAARQYCLIQQKYNRDCVLEKEKLDCIIYLKFPQFMQLKLIHIFVFHTYCFFYSKGSLIAFPSLVLKLLLSRTKFQYSDLYLG